MQQPDKNARRWYQIQFYYLPKWKLPNRCHANVAAQMCSHSVFHSLWIVVENGAKKCAMLISPHFLFLFFLFSFCLRLPLATALPAHQTKRTSKKCLLNCVCQLDVRFQNVRCAKVRRAPPDIPNVGSWTKTFLKLVKYLWFWSHWRMKKKKLREREKKQEKSKEGKI